MAFLDVRLSLDGVVGSLVDAVALLRADPRRTPKGEPITLLSSTGDAAAVPPLNGEDAPPSATLPNPPSLPLTT